MIRFVNGKKFDLGTAKGKAGYTLEAMKRRKALAARKRYKEINNTIMGLVGHCAKFASKR